jgi:hypoxanthine phosphoribosyltransferase
MAQPLHTFPDDTIQYFVPSWDDVDTVCLELAKKIHASGLHFDRLVTLAKGGWPFTRSLVDLLAIPEVASIGIRFYAGIGERLAQPQIYQDLPVAVKGEDVLLFDDVADSGESLAFTKQHLLEEGVASVTTATLYYKPRSIFLPDFYGQETSAWIVFPFETREGMTQLKERWAVHNLSEQTLLARFASMGLKAEAIKYFQSV